MLVQPQQCVCGNCGKQTGVIGYETAEQLDVEPAKYFVRVTKREKRACPHCPEQGVACAPLPARIIEKSLASDRLIIETIVNKYADHVPIYAGSGIKRTMPGGRLCRVADYAGSNGTAPPDGFFCARHSLKVCGFTKRAGSLVVGRQGGSGQARRWLAECVPKSAP